MAKKLTAERKIERERAYANARHLRELAEKAQAELERRKQRSA
ncbi:MAG TPA: hypothetical protein VM690_01645 [Gaiellaceae bacterium]|nr:hypothetical protein [Gaiellaceae bacterium]